MHWSDDEVGQAQLAKERTPTVNGVVAWGAQLRAIMTKAVELHDAKRARPKHSGQVADDVEGVADALRVLDINTSDSDTTTLCDSARVRLARLAAGAQEAADLRTQLAAMTDLRDGYRKAGALEHERANKAEAEVERLSGLLRIAEARLDTADSSRDVLREKASTAEGEMVRYRAEVESLKADRSRAYQAIMEEQTRASDAVSRAHAAESRLAAIQERATDAARIVREAEIGAIMGSGGSAWDDDVHADAVVYQPGLGHAAMRVARWVLDEDAQPRVAGGQEPATALEQDPPALGAKCAAEVRDTSTHGDYGGELREQHEDNDSMPNPPTIPESSSGPVGQRRAAEIAPIPDTIPYPQRHPHAFEPRAGSPEECGAEAGFISWCGYPRDAHHPIGRTLDPDAGPPEPASKVTFRYLCSPTCAHDDARTPGHAERVKERRRHFAAFAFREGRLSTMAREALTDGIEMAAWNEGHEEGVTAGAEAMRAACYEAVIGRLVLHGLQRFREEFKAAIEGATP